jgi:hypothetical protein
MLTGNAYPHPCSASSDRMNYPDTAVAGTRSTSQHATGHGLGVWSCLSSAIHSFRSADSEEFPCPSCRNPTQKVSARRDQGCGGRLARRARGFLPLLGSLVDSCCAESKTMSSAGVASVRQYTASARPTRRSSRVPLAEIPPRNYPDTAVAGTRSTSQHATGHGLGVLSLDSPPLSSNTQLPLGRLGGVPVSLLPKSHPEGVG